MRLIPQATFRGQIEFLRVEYFQSCAQALCLQFTPQFALVTAYTVHNSRYIPEFLLVIVLELYGGNAAAKKRVLIEVRLK